MRRIWTFLGKEVAVLVLLVGVAGLVGSGFNWLWEHIIHPQKDYAVMMNEANVSNAKIVAVVKSESIEVLKALSNSREAERVAREKESELASKLSINEEAIRAFFQVIGENNIPAENIRAKLIEIAIAYVDLRKIVSDLKSSQRQFIELAENALVLITSGRFYEGDMRLQEIERIARHTTLGLKEDTDEYKGAMWSLAQIKVARGDLAVTLLRYGQAVQLYEDAANTLLFSEGDRAAILLKVAETYFKLGHEQHNKYYMNKSTNIYSEAFDTLEPRGGGRYKMQCMCNINIYEWAHHKYTFGTALLELVKNGDEVDLMRAADAFQSAIDEKAAPLSIAEYYAALIGRSESYIIFSEKHSPAKLPPKELRFVGDTVSILSVLVKDSQIDPNKEGRDRVKVLLARSLTEYGLRLYGEGDYAGSKSALKDASNAIATAAALSSNKTRDAAVLEYDRARVIETIGIIENDDSSREKAKQVYERAKEMATAAASYDIVERIAADIYRIENARRLPLNDKRAVQ